MYWLLPGLFMALTKSSEPMSSTICLLCESVSDVDHENLGLTMLRVSTVSSTPLFDVRPMFSKWLVNPDCEAFWTESSRSRVFEM